MLKGMFLKYPYNKEGSIFVTASSAKRNGKIYGIFKPQIPNKQETPWPESASELYRPSDRSLLAKLVPAFADRGCHVVSVTDPYSGIIGFLGRTRYFCFKKLLNCTHEVDWTLFQTHYFPENLVVPENRTWTSGYVARNPDHYTIEAVKTKAQIPHSNNYIIALPYSKALLKFFLIVIKEYQEKFSCIVKVSLRVSLSNLPHFTLRAAAFALHTYITVNSI
jgi:hypothetical protein